MQNFKYVLVFLFGLSFGAFIWGISLFFLKKEPIFYIPIKKHYSFYSINLTDIFFNSSNHLNTHIKQVQKFQSLRGVKLKALYFDGKNGFVILEAKGKTYFVDLGKDYRGYKLIKIGKDFAIFEKNKKEYKIQMEKEKIKNSFSFKKEAVNTTKTISKRVFNNYLNNLDKIWQNIGIEKIQKGYIITYIRPHSIFEKIGLKKGDILVEVNGRKLKNDEDAWDLYKHAKEFRSFEIRILRDDKERVLRYEVE